MVGGVGGAELGRGRPGRHAGHEAEVGEAVAELDELRRIGDEKDATYYVVVPASPIETGVAERIDDLGTEPDQMHLRRIRQRRHRHLHRQRPQHPIRHDTVTRNRQLPSLFQVQQHLMAIRPGSERHQRRIRRHHRRHRITQPPRIGHPHPRRAVDPRWDAAGSIVVGLLLDLIEGTALGQHALILSLLAFLAAMVYPRFRAYSLVQQAVLVLVLLGLVQLIEQWLRTLTGEFSIHLSFLIPSLMSALLWPWLATMLVALERRMMSSGS